MDNILLWLWLTNMRGVSNNDITALLEKYDTISDIYNETDYSELTEIKPFARIRLKNKKLDDAKMVLAKAESVGAKVLTFDDIDYPDVLRTISNPPYVLYVRGNVMKWDRLLMIGAVGTRDCTDYGTGAARKICTGLAEGGVTVVSGLARGIDAAVACAALDAGGKTIAVLGCGIDKAYPYENTSLMARIIENGAVISEYPPGTPPNKQNFPWRNRIISGLSKGVLVVEAPKKSGALITASFALEQGRDIFAVPGSIFKSNSEGTNRLLAHSAKAVMNAEDILEEYPFERSRLEKPRKKLTAFFKGEKKEPIDNEIRLNVDDKRYMGLTDNEKSVIGLLIDGNLHIDDIKRKSGLDVSDLTPILAILEFGGYIRKLPGNNYKLSI